MHKINGFFKPDFIIVVKFQAFVFIHVPYREDYLIPVRTSRTDRTMFTPIV